MEYYFHPNIALSVDWAVSFHAKNMYHKHAIELAKMGEVRYSADGQSSSIQRKFVHYLTDTFLSALELFNNDQQNHNLGLLRRQTLEREQDGSINAQRADIE